MRAKFPYNKRRKRVGRGPGSGHGKTSCRGQKGQMSRSGSSRTPGFEGGQTPFLRRIPKRGFTHVFKKHFAIVNLDTLARLEEKEISPQKLLARGVVKKLGDGLKVLGAGELKGPVTIWAHRFSGQAKEKIEKAGGKALLVETGVIPRNQGDPGVTPRNQGV